MNNADAIANYRRQLSSRFYSNSMAVEVLACLLLIFILVIELVKLAKKTYEWQADHEMRIEQRHAEESRSILRERTQLEAVPSDNRERERERAAAVKEEDGKGRGERLKKEAYVPAVVAIEEVIKNKLPQMAIIAINVVNIASYEYCAIVSYIAVVIIVIAELIGNEHARLKLGLDIVSKALLISLYVNVFTVPKPTQP